MPLLAVLAAAAHVCRRVNHALFKQSNARRAESRTVGDVEAAVTVQDRRIVAGEFESLLVGDEHRHARAAFTVVEKFFGLKVGWNEAGTLAAAKRRRLLRGDAE